MGPGESVRTFDPLITRLVNVCLLLLISLAARGQQPPSAEAAPAPSAPKVSMTSAWGSVLQDSASPAPPLPPDSLAGSSAASTETGSTDDFLNHAFFEGRTEYRRAQTAFTGLPTVTGVIDAIPGQPGNPPGTPYPSDFQPSTNAMYSFLSWGTRGWLSDRINTNFSFRYQQDLTHTNQGSPSLSVVNTFTANREVQLLAGYVDINSRPSDGWLAGSTLRVGRQDVYSAELAAFDGVSFTLNQPKFSYTVYGGRRFSYYTDPKQRLIGGGNFVWRLGKATLEYEALYYVKGTHLFSYRQQFARGFFFSTQFRMVGGSPVEYTASGFWSPPNGKTTVRLDFAQQLTNRDYFYDYTGVVHDRDPYNRLVRLNLGAIAPHTQVLVDVHRVLTSRLHLGGSVWIRRLSDARNQGAFDTPFQDYRANAQVYPWRKITVFLDFHQRDSNRFLPNSTGLDDIATTGERRTQDVSAEIGRSFGEGRVSVKAGAFYRLLDFQGIFFGTTQSTAKGALGSASVKLNPRTRAYAEYSLDTDYPIFRPDIRNTQTLRLGLAWRY